MLSLLSLLTLSVATAQTVPADAPIERAVSIQVTQTGLDNFGAFLPALIPESLAIDDVRQSGGGGFCLAEFELELGNTAAGMGVEVALEIVDIRFRPVTGRLNTQIDLLVSINDSGNPFDFNFDVACISGNCAGWVRPFPVTATVPFQLAVVTAPDGSRVIDATVEPITIDNGLNNTHIELIDSCSTLDTIDSVLAAFNLSIYDFIIGVVDPFLAGAIDDQVGDIELQIEDALSAARYEDVIDLAGAELSVLIEPRDIDITPGGLTIDLLGAISSPADPCIADLDPGGSLLTDTLVPEIGDNPAGTEFIIHVGDELVNQGLYGVWRSGLLCYEISAESEIDIGFPIDSSLLGLLGGEGFEDILPEEPQPIVIVTNPIEAPTADFEGGYDLTAEVRELGLDIFTEIDFRQTRALGLTIEADAGVDIVFDGNTGLLAADIALGPDNITIIATHNELVVEASAAIEDSVSGLVGVLLDSLVGDALSGFEFSLPSFEGVGLVTAEAAPSGDGDWLGLTATIGDVPYEGAGCDEAGGCSGGDTTGGCSSAAGGMGAALFLLPLVLVRRRRQ
ncbi:MAG: hypothetical protein ACJAZO_000492 [Myxococcota bacterium]